MTLPIKKKVGNYEQFVSTAISRGYALVALWAPGAVNVLLVMQATGAKWIDLFLPGVFLSFLGLATSFLLERKYNLTDKETFVKTQDNCKSIMNPKEAKNKVVHILLVVTSLILVTIFLERINFASSSNRIMIAGTLVIIIWCIEYIKDPNIKINIDKYWNKEVNKNLDLATLFIAVGIFAEAIGGLGIVNYLEGLLLNYGNYIYPFIIILIPVIIVLSAIMGIHPFISIVMLGKIIGSIALPFSKVSIALSLGVGGVISYVVSPFAGIVLTLAKFIDCSSRKISLIWNLKFSVVYLVESVIFIYIYNML